MSRFSAGALAKAMNDADRRAVIGALACGAMTVSGVARMTGRDARALTTAIGRLDELGVIVWDRSSGDLHLIEQVFVEAARDAASKEQPEAANDDTDPVVRAFVKDGRLTSIPVQHAKRMVILNLLAQEFEPGERYSEAMVNLKLGRWHADTAALRRYLVDNDFLSREDRIYWRSGGSVETVAHSTAGDDSHRSYS
jgi:hypothetical protein